MRMKTMATAVVAVMMAVPAMAEEQTPVTETILVKEEVRHGPDIDGGLWSPAAGGGFLQLGWNLNGESRQLHLTLAEVHVSLLRVGKFRFPALGVDFQTRIFGDDRGTAVTGHFLATAGVTFTLGRKTRKMYVREGVRHYHHVESWIHAKVGYDLREDTDPRIGHWNFIIGLGGSF